MEQLKTANKCCHHPHSKSVFNAWKSELMSDDRQRALSIPYYDTYTEEDIILSSTALLKVCRRYQYSGKNIPRCTNCFHSDEADGARSVAKELM